MLITLIRDTCAIFWLLFYNIHHFVQIGEVLLDGNVVDIGLQHAKVITLYHKLAGMGHRTLKHSWSQDACLDKPFLSVVALPIDFLIRSVWMFLDVRQSVLAETPI